MNITVDVFPGYIYMKTLDSESAPRWAAIHLKPIQEFDADYAEHAFEQLYVSLNIQKRLDECGCRMKIGSVSGFTWKNQCPECLKWFNIEHELIYEKKAA